ncbi:BamA/TamA family outer membrane protein [Bdellovibrio sp. HCB337]|uniref:BamA/TamA family outer membrane protein n=1 Tax=Bdellovibrio sp. HCB337 TaxID=3394358 RepID=UPI0039A57B0B
MRKLIGVLFILILALSTSLQTQAQVKEAEAESDILSGNYSPSYSTEPKVPIESNNMKELIDDAPFGKKVQGKKREWIIAPVPNYSPAQGWGLAVLAQVVLKSEQGNKPSIFAGGIFGTQKKSYGGALAYLGKLNDDKFRLNILGGYAKVNSDFYGVGKRQSSYDMSVLLEQDVDFFAIQAIPKMWGIYLGPTIAYIHMKNQFDIAGLPSDFDSPDSLTEDSWVPGIKLEADTRDNTFYPLHGYMTNFTALFYDERLSGSYTFQRYQANHNMYLSLGDEKVLATRLNAAYADGDVPFYFMPSFGTGSDLRGYKAGKYRDKFIWDVQTEYRTRFTDRWGGVLFIGAGDVLPSITEFNLQDLLWAGGLGARFRIAEENPIDFRIDVAYGDKEVSTYFSVHQAF